MSVQEAKTVLEEARFKFQFYLKQKGMKPDMLAPVIGRSTTYVRQLLSGAASGPAAREHLKKLFDFTGYHGEIWF
ncbi:hypothetical protein H7198_06090 [Fructobacillus sp. CRL 2054]|uniref:hypothetical protein n=1 Tax=Fructobacillus sp. CRL 2054 TaxID=2763007 RepID=UPI00237986F0|nr:hypothetical protein [Fructobacillus sp. CRL 2054]MDD9139171.1 hypothetical protein [Fructobacillus sp. CRL 2054]